MMIYRDFHTGLLLNSFPSASEVDAWAEQFKRDSSVAGWTSTTGCAGAWARIESATYTPGSFVWNDSGRGGMLSIAIDE